MRRLTRDGVDLTYDDDGTGPAVLLSHCWLCDARQWPQARAVAQAGYRVLNLDNRGHGRSGPHQGRYTLWDVAEDLRAVLDDAEEERAVVVGLSIGGYAALRLALRHPSRVRALVLAATTAGVESRWGRVKARTLAPLFVTPARPLLMPAVLNLLFGPTALRMQPALIAEWRQRFLAQDPGSMTSAFNAAIVRRDDVTSQLGRISVPTLVIAGEEDPGLPAAAAMAAAIAGARFVTLPATGHLSALESPGRFEAVLLDFLHDLDGPLRPTRV